MPPFYEAAGFWFWAVGGLLTIISVRCISFYCMLMVNKHQVASRARAAPEAKRAAASKAVKAKRAAKQAQEAAVTANTNIIGSAAADALKRKAAEAKAEADAAEAEVVRATAEEKEALINAEVDEAASAGVPTANEAAMMAVRAERVSKQHARLNTL